ncbi:adenosylcobinamide-phosphate synthase CbiB, partial [Salmonella enterica]
THRWLNLVPSIGRLIPSAQLIVRRYCPSAKALRIGGGVTWVVVVGATGGEAWAVLALAQRIHPWFCWS